MGNKIDVRGTRVSAFLTTLVLAGSLITESLYLLFWQTLVFALGTMFGPRLTPYAYFFTKVIKPKIKSFSEFEDEKPVRFSQGIGLMFCVMSIAAIILDIENLFLISTSMAVIASFLNAFFGLCLGCKIYLILQKSKIWAY